ncbi:MAG: hypothetical protein A2Y10_04340 [Planctomycetes bacterium GWF2_41_51]|nr:MAG: hypothetical protein A2Y10_04340 [Planctomycetes bacterium GWF2_41_51]
MSQTKISKVVCSQGSNLFYKIQEGGGTMNGKNIKSMGFTLVELLVVVSIIAMLLAILMPSLSKAREQAVRIVCASNMKSTGTSMAMYLSDNKGTLPPDFMFGRAEGKESNDDLTTVFWQQKLIPYTKNGKVFTCSNYEKYFSTKSSSANKTKQEYLYNQVNKDTNWYYWYCSGEAPSFGYNHRALGCGGWKSGEFGCYPRQPDPTGANTRLPVLQVKAERIKNGSGTILCLDNVSSFAASPSTVRDPANSLSNSEWMKKYHPQKFLHNKGMNLLYVDCHAVWKSSESPEFKPVGVEQDHPSWGNCRQF